MAAGDIVYVGGTGWVEQPERKDYVQGQWKRIRTWFGPQDTIDAQILAIQILLLPEEIHTAKGWPAVIEAMWGDVQITGGEPPEVIAESTATWELVSQDLEKPLHLHGVFNQSTVFPQVDGDGTGADLLEQIEEAIRKGTARGFVFAAGPGKVALDFYVACRLRGIESYLTFQYIIRKTLRFSSPTQIWSEFSDEPGSTSIPGKIIGYADVQVPADAKFKQPKIRVATQAVGLTAVWKSRPINQWMVKGPQMRWDKGKYLWEFTREFWGAEQWLNYIYEFSALASAIDGDNPGPFNP